MMSKSEFNNGRIVGLAISKERGTKKGSIEFVRLVENSGIEGDAHRDSYREVSLLSIEERDKIALKKLKPGEAAENILIEGIKNLSEIKKGEKILLGESAILEVLQVGKETHDSPIHRFTGRPVLPTVGVFCRVLKGGTVRIGDKVRVV